MVVSLMIGVAHAQPTEKDMSNVPDRIVGVDLKRVFPVGEPVGRPAWPIRAEYGYGMDDDFATMQCWNENQMGSCSSKGYKKLKLSGGPACYMPPDYGAKYNEGAAIDWFDGVWSCFIQFKRPFNTPKGAKEEVEVVKNYAQSAHAQIMSFRSRPDRAPGEHEVKVGAARAESKRRRR